MNEQHTVQMKVPDTMTSKTEKQKMLAGEYYSASDSELQADQLAAAAWMQKYNGLTARPSEWPAALRERLGAVGANSVIRPPFYCDYGYNVFLGQDVFINFNCVMLDVCEIRIGDKTLIGPGVQIMTASHPMDHDLRRTGLEFAKPISIGSNVWIGGGAQILPGVSIGDNAIIGSGAVVTKNIEAGVTVVGNPARPVLKKVQ